MNTNFLESINHKMQAAQIELKTMAKDTEKVEKINPNEIGNWEYRDRQSFELGDITSLAENIELCGQAQPIIIVLANNIFRSIENPTAKYVVIAGYRRWLACKQSNMTVDAIVRFLNFEQAIACLVSENEKEQVSDYSKGMFYANLLKREGIKKKTLYERLGIKKGVFDNYISFSEVPEEIWRAVGSLKNVSARTSSTIKLICQKGPEEKNALIAIANKISEGIGEKKIIALVGKIIRQNNTELSSKKDNNISFSENIVMKSSDKSIKIVANKLASSELEKLKLIITKAIEKFLAEK